MSHTIKADTEHSPERPLAEFPRGTVVSLQLCPGHRKPMCNVESVEALAGIGLKGDRHAMEESSRQILLIDLETLHELGLKPGIVKENITISGIPFASLRQGQQLRVGTVVLQITKPCTPCSRMDEIRPGLQEELRGRRGMLARVLRGGTMRVGDVIHVLEV